MAYGDDACLVQVEKIRDEQAYWVYLMTPGVCIDQETYWWGRGASQSTAKAFAMRKAEEWSKKYDPPLKIETNW